MMEQKKNIQMLAPLLATVAVLLVSVLGPEQMARYKDKSTLNEITVVESEGLNAIH